MAEMAKKFIDRAPRYVLRASDNKFLRFAPDADHHNIYTTQLMNLSITGLAFLCNQDQAPHLGDLVKMEFPVPGSEQIAWWGKVVRLEDYRLQPSWQKNPNEDFTAPEKLVAVRFENLPKGHMANIKQGLQSKAIEMARQRRFQFAENKLEFMNANWRQLSLFSFSILLTILILFVLSRPIGNYTLERGAPWGQRFK